MDNFVELLYSYDNINLTVLEDYFRDHYSNYLGYSLYNNDLRLYFRDINEQEISEVNNFILQLKSENPPIYYSEKTIKEKILKKIAFGKKIILECSCYNYKNNLSTDEVKIFIDKTKNIMILLETGSLYTAREEIMALESDGIIITDHMKNYFLKKIEEFLYEEDGYVS